VSGLKHSGFTLTDERDHIVWSWDNKLGKVFAKQAYEVQFLEDLEEEQNEWMRDIWNWHIPFRIKLFFWFMIENKIITWDNLITVGFPYIRYDRYLIYYYNNECSIYREHKVTIHEWMCPLNNQQLFIIIIYFNI